MDRSIYKYDICSCVIQDGRRYYIHYYIDIKSVIIIYNVY